MHDLIQHLQAGQELEAHQIKDAAAVLLDPDPEATLKADFLRALAQKGETPAEIVGFVREFLVHAVTPALAPEHVPGPLLDVVGTGGDKLNLFNVSSTAMFILAAGGVYVAKHGNRGITSKSGGADVLEALGVKISLPPEDLSRSVREVGLGFMFAQQYHPAFKAVIEARKILALEGRRSIFNILGPLLNPAQPPYQLLGVFDSGLTQPFARILQELGRKSAWVVHGEAGDGRGMDEMSTLGINRIAKLKENEITEEEIHATDIGFASADLGDLVGGSATENADILEGVLAGRIKGGKRDIAVLNAAAGFVITGLAVDLKEGRALAEDLLDRGAAHHKLEDVRAWL